MTEMDIVKRAAISAAVSMFLGAVQAPPRPTMFLRQVKGAGAWGRSSRKASGGSGDYRAERSTGSRAFFGGTRA